MSKKAHRVASRQAQLSQKKRKPGKERPTLAPIERPVKDGQQTKVLEETVVLQELAKPRPQPAAPQPAPRHPVYSYVKSEILRIGIVGGIALVALVVLTFVLN